MTFIERINYLRKERNLTRTQVLKDCNLGKNSFINWENGISWFNLLEVHIKTFLAIAGKSLHNQRVPKNPPRPIWRAWGI